MEEEPRSVPLGEQSGKSIVQDGKAQGGGFSDGLIAVAPEQANAPSTETKGSSAVEDEQLVQQSTFEGNKDESKSTKLAEQMAGQTENASAAGESQDRSPGAASDNDDVDVAGKSINSENAADLDEPLDPMAVDEIAPDASEGQRQPMHNITAGFKVYCLGSGKNRQEMTKTHAIMRYDLDKCNWEFTVKDGEEEKKMSLKEFCLTAGNGAKGTSRCRDQIFDANSGELLLWQKLHLQSREIRKKTGRKHAWGHASSNPSIYKSYKRRREQSDSDEDEETSWARAQKQCEAQERFERNETFQARRKAEQEALNNSFFRIHGRKKEENESIYGLDLTSNLLLDGFGCKEDGPAVERAKRLHELIQSGKIKDDGKGATVPYIRHDELHTDSELLNKVSREFVKTSTIHVKEGRLVPSRAEYDPAPSKDFHKQYQAGRIEAPAVVEHSVAMTPKKSTGRWNKTASAGHAQAQHPQPGSLNIAQTRVVNGSKMESGAWEWETEEIRLFDALFACYDDDAGSLARLLRTKSEKQVKEMIGRSKDDVRCEVCRNPEDEEKMMLCDRCDKGYHTFCLSPPLPDIPEGDWFCAACTSQTSLRAAETSNVITRSSRAVPLAGDDLWWDTKSLQLQDLEQRAVDELVASVNELSLAQLRKAGQEEEGSLSKLSLHDVHWARIRSIFSVCLLTCPVPIRNEAASVIQGPLRRHLRVVVAAARKAFALEEILAVSDAREQGLDRVEQETLEGAAEERTHAWIFQVNAQLMDIGRLLKDQKEIRCLVGRHATRVGVGDKVFIWKSGEVCYEYGRVKPVGGALVAVGRVQSKVDTQPLPASLVGYCRPLCQRLAAFEKRPSCTVSIQHIMASPVHVNALRQNKACAGLPILISSAGSVFKLSEKQVKVVDDALTKEDASYAPQTHVLAARQPSAPGKRSAGGAEKEVKEIKYVARGHFVHPNESDASDNEAEEDDKDSDSEAENSERRPNWMRQCAVILAKMRRHRDAKPFQKPVDIAGLGLTDYLDVLKQEGCEPIDFETIEKNLNSGVYKRDKDFCRDVRRVFYNASVYNPEDDPVYLMARNISGEFEPSWAKYKRDKRKRKAATGPRKKDKEGTKGRDDQGQGAGDETRQDSHESAAGAEAMDVSVDEERKDESSASANAGGQEGKDDPSAEPTADAAEPAGSGATGTEGSKLDGSAADEGAKQEEGQDKEMRDRPPDAEPCSVSTELKAQAVEADGMAGCDSAEAMQTDDAEGEGQKRCMVCDGFSGIMIRCDATGACFHLECLEDPITHPPDGPWVSPLAVLQSKRKVQHAAEDGGLHPTCPACSKAATGPLLVCGGCKQKYHPQCVRNASVLAQDRICLCSACEGFLPPSQERQLMLQVLLRREVLIECRRLLHLHCELCSRDRQRDLDTELHRFRVLKQTARLGDRIFEYNRVLLEEANELLGQVFAAIP